MKSSKKYTLTEGMFTWLLKTLVGKDRAAKMLFYKKIHSDPKLAKLSREFEKAAKDLQKSYARHEKSPFYDKQYHDELLQILNSGKQ